LDAAELAELVTLLSPSDALDEASDAFSFTAPAASDVLEALRRPARRTANVDCRSTARDAARDIVRAGRGVEMAGADGVGVVVMSTCWHKSCRLVTIFPVLLRSVRSGLSGESFAAQQHHDINIVVEVHSVQATVDCCYYNSHTTPSEATILLHAKTSIYHNTQPHTSLTYSAFSRSSTLLRGIQDRSRFPR
jgi:hypothetical protein